MVGTAVRLVLFEQASSLDDPEKSTPSRHAAEEMGAIYATVTRQLPRSPTHPAATAAGTAQSPPCDNAAVLSNFSHENARPSMARLIVLKRTTENTCLYVKR